MHLFAVKLFQATKLQTLFKTQKQFNCVFILLKVFKVLLYKVIVGHLACELWTMTDTIKYFYLT